MADVKSAGGWVEVVAPGVSTTLNPATMPHALVSEADGTFTFKQLDWAQRDVGDDVTNPVPSFVGNRINDVFFTRNRLGFLTSENVVMSRAGGQFFNFFRETATQVLDTDPIDLAATEKDLSILTSAVPFNEDILLFSPKTQFRFTSGGGLFTPKTVQMKPTSKFDNSSGCVPVSAGSSIYFTVDRQTSTGVMEYVVDANTNTADALEVTEHVPRYLPVGITKMVVSTSERMLLAISRSDPSAIYAYSYYARGEERLQSSWSRWEIDPNASVLDLGVFGSEAVLLIQRPDGVHMEAMRLPSNRQDGSTDFVTHLDRRLTETQVQMSYDAAAKATVVALPYQWGLQIGGDLQVWERFDGPATRNPRRIHFARATPTQIVLPGDMRSKKFFIGIVNESSYEFSEQFLRQEGVARTDGRLQMRRMGVQYAETGGFIAEVRNGGRELIDQENLQARGEQLWDALKRYEGSGIKQEGVTLYVPVVPGFADTGPLQVQFIGVLNDGRYYARIQGSGGGTVEAQIGAGGHVQFDHQPSGVKAVQLVRTRDHAVVHQELFGLEGPGGVLLVGNGENFLVANTSGLVVDIAPDGGALLRAYHTAGDENVERAQAHNNRYIVAAQAKAILAAVTWNVPSYAARWIRPLLATQAGDGRFPTELDATTLTALDGTYARQTQCWVALALTSFAKTYPGHALTPDMRSKLVRLMDHLDTRIVASGHLQGLLMSDGGVASSTENMVAYFAYRNAAAALGVVGYATKAAAIGAGIERVFWHGDHARYVDTADSAGNQSPSITPNWLAPLFAYAYGSHGRAMLAREWFSYFETADGSARGYAHSAANLQNMGDITYGVGGLASEHTFHAIISKAASERRNEARLAFARMTPLMGDMGVRNSQFDGQSVPWWDMRATAMAIVALYPATVFGVNVPPLWTEGPQPVSRNPPFRYVCTTDGPDGEGKFDWPVSANAENARVTIRSLGALPFSLLGATWEGYFTARAQKV